MTDTIRKSSERNMFTVFSPNAIEDSSYQTLHDLPRIVKQSDIKILTRESINQLGQLHSDEEYFGGPPDLDSLDSEGKGSFSAIFSNYLLFPVCPSFGLSNRCMPRMPRILLV